MELYVLDSLLRRTAVVDVFESLIWTDRWKDMGDFELKIRSNQGTRNLLTQGTKLALNESYRVMTVLTIEDKVESDGKEILLLKGKSLEYILADRAAVYDLDATPWIIADTPDVVATEIFDHVVRNVVDPPTAYDGIPLLQSGLYFPVGTILPYSASILWEQKPETLYKAIKDICDLYDLGFRLIRTPEGLLYFEIYSGDDRTTRQTDFSPVVFSPKLDNLQNTTEFTSVQDAKNMAYVYSAHGSTIVYAEGVEPETTGFARRVLLVNVSDTTDEMDAGDVLEILEQRGFEELQKVRGVALYDGEIDQRSNAYIYEVDWRVGDLVELRNKDGVITYSRISEAILVSDSEGDRIYPTLVATVIPGADTWVALNDNPITWSEMTTEEWEDM